MIQRYSSRLKRLDAAFLNDKLKRAKAYDRIAGYFSSSILEAAGEAIEAMEGRMRVVCNSGLDLQDLATLSAAHNAMRREWCEAQPEKYAGVSAPRYSRLLDFLSTGKMEVKVVPDHIFGLIHGKAGVITLADGRKTSFIGSINETYAGWRKNYEILWEDDSPEGVAWVEDEFNYFFNHPGAVPLTRFVQEDLRRIIKRTVIYSVDDWQKQNDPASTVIESPVYRQELGLWEHQKYFVSLAFNAHKNGGARLVLADQVGLGKTVQLALAAQLMALVGERPVLVLAPKTLLFQWQDELNTLLEMPSAVWTGRAWVDEQGVTHPAASDDDIKRCPRRVGILSQGLITHGAAVKDALLGMEYECVIVDEAHRARRRNIGAAKEGQAAEPNNMLRFINELSRKTKSMLLATATPVQMHPIEAWDLLHALSRGGEAVLGNNISRWRGDPWKALALVMGRDGLDTKLEAWEWLRNPFPPAEELNDFLLVRKKLGMGPDEHVIPGDVYHKLDNPTRSRVDKIIDGDFLRDHNPFIRFIIRRTRDYLEKTINPETSEPYLKPIEVKLYGEDESGTVVLPPYLKEAYEHAERFCGLLQQRVAGGGFLKTLLLKRVGSTMVAGRRTAEKMLRDWAGEELYDEFEDDDSASFEEEESIETRGRKPKHGGESELKQLTDAEKRELGLFVEKLGMNTQQDPKYHLVREILFDRKWLERGCIIFSQYYDSVLWLAENLSRENRELPVGVYAGGDKSRMYINGEYQRKSRDEIKAMVKRREIRLLIGTDATSEGLNLQALSSLVNLDLPWNPTRLEQRKGRIQRIGQESDDVWIYNLRYKDSVEDKVHSLLSSRLKDIYDMFGQLPDVLEDVWVKVAENEIEEARSIIDAVPRQHPFEIRNSAVERVDWESCSTVLDSLEKRKYLMKGWWK